MLFYFTINYISIAIAPPQRRDAIA